MSSTHFKNNFIFCQAPWLALWGSAVSLNSSNCIVSCPNYFWFLLRAFTGLPIKCLWVVVRSDLICVSSRCSILVQIQKISYIIAELSKKCHWIGAVKATSPSTNWNHELYTAQGMLLHFLLKFWLTLFFFMITLVASSEV